MLNKDKFRDQLGSLQKFLYLYEMEISGIYTVTNIKNSKVYVGCATQVNKRLSNHKRDLINKKHKNIYLQRAWEAGEESDFEFSLLEECPIEYLASLEHYWATLLDSHNNKRGYNIRPTHPYGKIVNTKEIRNKISATNKGRNFTTPESIRKGLETRKKNAELRGYYFSEETRQLLSKKAKGKKHSAETCAKLSESLKGRKLSQKAIDKRVKSREGYKHSEETKKKMSKPKKKKIK